MAFFYKIQNMIEKIKNSGARTIHKLLIELELKRKDVREMKDTDNEVYDLIKSKCDEIIADLYEFTLDKPRQAQQYLTLIKAQEEYYQKIFVEENEDTLLAPKIEIIKQESETSLNIDFEEQDNK